jgi:hypothetical protein
MLGHFLVHLSPSLFPSEKDNKTGGRSDEACIENKRMLHI